MNPLASLHASRHSNALRTCLALACAAVLCSAAFAQTYSIDDGTAESGVGFGNGSSNSGAIWLNSFARNPSFSSIASVSIAFGAPGSGTPANGQSIQALLYNDPNGDGNPLDAVLLASVSGVISSIGTNTFVTFTFSSAVAITTSNFFVGFKNFAFTAGGSEQFVAGLDTTAPTFANRSFVSAKSDGSDPSTTNLSSNTVNGSIESFGLSGNWLIRANAVNQSTVPDTGSSMLLLAVAAAGLIGSRRLIAARA